MLLRRTVLVLVLMVGGCSGSPGLSGPDAGDDSTGGGDTAADAPADAGGDGQDDLGDDPADAGPDALTDGPPADGVPDQPPGPPVALWELPRQGPNHFALPWPSDLALSATGHADLGYVPNDSDNVLLARTVEILDGVVDGFSPVGGTYFRFATPLDLTTLPTAAADFLAPTALLQIIDVDPASPERGTRRPGQIYYHEEQTDYWPAHTLAIAPAFGFPLRERTRYALVVKRGVRDASGTAYERDLDLEAVLAPSGGSPEVIAARGALSQPLSELALAGVARDEILSLAVFTTQDCTGELFRVTDAVRDTADPALLRDDVTCTAATGNQTFHRCTGHYGPNPVYQQGDLPYTTPGTGGFAFDAGGQPLIHQVIDIRFSLAIPLGQPPTGGWPLVIYAHGTGGDSASHIRDGTAGALASQGLASLGFDQLFNGERISGEASDSNAELQFYNVLNVIAGRTNNRQAAVDLVQLGRLIETGLVIPAAVSPTAVAIPFSTGRPGFFGHSQGGLNGPLWFAAENGSGAGVFSGAGATLSISLVQKTEPVNIPELVGGILGIAPDSGEIVPLHPVMTLLQTAVDVEDPVNYGRMIIMEPRPGLPPRHVYQTQGFVDHFAPPEGIATLAQSIGLQLVEPVLYDVPGYAVGGVPVATGFPISLNLAGGTATGVWQQWNAADGMDGHFVIRIPEARERAAGFLASYFADPDAPVIP